MATKQFYFSGLITWAKRTLDDRYKNWTINLYPDDESKAAMKASGLQVRPKEDKDGKLYYTFRRPESKVIKGETVNFEPPSFSIVQDGKAIPFDGIVGNGSKGTIKVSVYDIPATGGKGHRYEGVLITDLVEYVPPQTNETVPGAIAAAPGVRVAAQGPSIPF